MKTSRLHQCARLALFLCAAVFFSASSAAVHAADPGISYSISLDNPEQHLLQVQITLPPGAAERELQLPVWNATYQIRDFAQYVNWVRAWVPGKDRAANALPVRKLNKSLWRIQGAANGAVVEYQIYADYAGPFGAQLNPHHGFFNLAEILMYPVDARNAPDTVRFTHLPAEWKIVTPMKSAGDAFIADNYDRMVDSPVEIGTFQESDFDQSGGHFRVVIDADPADYDMAKIVVDLHKITAAAISWMNDRPFDTYTFLYHFPRGPAGGGMEHAYGTAIDLNAESIRQSLYPVTDVTAHEFFHLWNVKRIRPKTLEPVDYTKENYTRALWFSEGVTSTAEEIIQLRAGLIDEKQFLKNLGDQITELQSRPAHLTQSAEESSLDAWLEGNGYYRRPERSISYYNKGELLGFLLDLRLREATAGRATLREALQWMNVNFAQKHQYFDDSNGVRQAAEAVSHADLAGFFAKYVAGTEEIPWDDFFRYVGLRIESISVPLADPGFIASRNFDGPVTVVAVTPGGDAEHAGLQVGDAITQVQGKSMEESRWLLSQLHPGDSLSVKVRSRRGVERELQWKVGSRDEIKYEVKDLDQVTSEQRARRAAWLQGEAETAPGKASGAAAP